MSRHTSGPWIVESLVDGYDIHAPESGCFVATTSDPEMVWGAVTRKGDAHLIAAAPEMLEALEIALDCAGDAWWAEKAEAAIEKAKGESNA